MVLRGAVTLGLAVGLVSLVTAIATPQAAPWSVRVTGVADAASLATAAQLCSTVAFTPTLAEEQYALGRSVPTRLGVANTWVTDIASAHPSASPAVVCVFHRTRRSYGAVPLVPDVVTVIASVQSVQSTYLSAVPPRALLEGPIGPASSWFVR